MLNVFSRLYGRILKLFLEENYKSREDEFQAGFRVGRSTIDHIFVIKQLIEKINEVGQQIHFVFVDLEKAYDSIPLQNLWEILNEMSINKNLLMAIKKLYDGAISQVQICKNLSESIFITKGLRQGCSLSPTLFKIYLQKSLETWKKKVDRMGVPIGNKSLYTLLFADDQVIIAQDAEDVEYMFRKLLEEYQKWGLKINMEKTLYMGCGVNNRDLILQFGKGKIKHCSEFKYLGVKINKDGNQEDDIRQE